MSDKIVNKKTGLEIEGGGMVMGAEYILSIVIALWVIFGPLVAAGGALVMSDGEHEHKKLGARVVLFGLFLPIALPICTIYFLLVGLVYLFIAAFGE